MCPIGCREKLTMNRKGMFNHSSYSKQSDMAREHFLNLVNSEVDYYGADSGDLTFKIDGIVFKAVEDPDDGYRSLLGTIDYTSCHDSLFFRLPIARVQIEEYYGEGEPDGFYVNKGYRLVDVLDGHIWLEFGTDNYDDYYPMFRFTHYPKKQSM